MSEPKITTEQDLIDKGAFPEDGFVVFHETGKGHSHQLLRWKNQPEVVRKSVMDIQHAVWAAAIEWERSSPFSASNKRIKQLESIIE